MTWWDPIQKKNWENSPWSFYTSESTINTCNKRVYLGYWRPKCKTPFSFLFIYFFSRSDIVELFILEKTKILKSNDKNSFKQHGVFSDWTKLTKGTFNGFSLRQQPKSSTAAHETEKHRCFFMQSAVLTRVGLRLPVAASSTRHKHMEVFSGSTQNQLKFEHGYI